MNETFGSLGADLMVNFQVPLGGFDIEIVPAAVVIRNPIIARAGVVNQIVFVLDVAAVLFGGLEKIQAQLILDEREDHLPRNHFTFIQPRSVRTADGVDDVVVFGTVPFRAPTTGTNLKRAGIARFATGDVAAAITIIGCLGSFEVFRHQEVNDGIILLHCYLNAVEIVSAMTPARTRSASVSALLLFLVIGLLGFLEFHAVRPYDFIEGDGDGWVGAFHFVGIVGLVMVSPQH